MAETINKRYNNQILNDLIRYFMRTILHLQDAGIQDLPLKHAFPEPIGRFLNLALEVLIDGQPIEIAQLILQAEYDVILHQDAVTSETALNLQIIKELSLHIHYDEDYYGYLLSTGNLWGNEIFEYAARTFYPNLPDGIKDKYGIWNLIKHLPQEMLRLGDY